MPSRGCIAFLSGIRQVRRRRQRLLLRRKEIAGELGQISLNESLCRQAARIEALSEHESWITSAEQQLGVAEATAKSLADQRQIQYRSSATNGAAVFQPAAVVRRQCLVGIAQTGGHGRENAAPIRRHPSQSRRAASGSTELPATIRDGARRLRTARFDDRPGRRWPASFATSPPHSTRRTDRSTCQHAG